ncbi:MAG: hypothetical protein ACOX5R_07165 [bacterium]
MSNVCYIEVHFYGHYLIGLEDLIKRYSLNENVYVHDNKPFEEILKVQQNADVLLFLDWCDPNYPGILTGKLFEYIASGRPILCIGKAKDTCAGKLIEELGVGVSCGDDVEMIEEFLLHIIKNGKWLHYNPDIEKIEYYSRENQVKRLIKIIDEYSS